MWIFRRSSDSPIAIRSVVGKQCSGRPLSKPAVKSENRDCLSLALLRYNDHVHRNPTELYLTWPTTSAKLVRINSTSKLKPTRHPESGPQVSPRCPTLKWNVNGALHRWVVTFLVLLLGEAKRSSRKRMLQLSVVSDGRHLKTLHDVWMMCVNGICVAWSIGCYISKPPVPFYSILYSATAPRTVSEFYYLYTVLWNLLRSIRHLWRRSTWRSNSVFDALCEINGEHMFPPTIWHWSWSSYRWVCGFY